MNFYKRHLGDIAKACGHLSQGQMGAYDLLLDWLYSNEKPLPLLPDSVHRIGRAVTKAEKANVDAVLAEFFLRTAEGYTQKRAIEEIAKADAQADTNRRIAEAREAAKRARKEHEACNEPSNASYTNRQPSQTPDTRHQEAIGDSRPAPEITQGQGTDAGLACRLMREAGCVQVNPSHPDLIAALAEGVTPEALADTTREAIAGNVRKPFAYAITTARGRHADGAKPTPGASHVPAHLSGSGRASLADQAAGRLAKIIEAGNLVG